MITDFLSIHQTNLIISNTCDVLCVLLTQERRVKNWEKNEKKGNQAIPQSLPRTLCRRWGCWRSSRHTDSPGDPAERGEDSQTIVILPGLWQRISTEVQKPRILRDFRMFQKRINGGRFKNPKLGVLKGILFIRKNMPTECNDPRVRRYACFHFKCTTVASPMVQYA